MRSLILRITLLVLAAFVMPAMAGESHDMKGHGDGKGDSGGNGKIPMASFEHQVVVEGVRVEFQVMSLARMNMTDTEGKTHHIMVRFFKDGVDHPIDSAVGSIKVVAPDKQSQTGRLKNYGGILAANFTFTEEGRYGVICLFKIDGKKRVAKFWYPHKA